MPNPRKQRPKPQKPHAKHPKAPKTKRAEGDARDFVPAIKPGYPEALDLDEGRR